MFRRSPANIVTAQSVFLSCILEFSVKKIAIRSNGITGMHNMNRLKNDLSGQSDYFYIWFADEGIILSKELIFAILY
jgi:hypothetical protein